MLSWYARAVLAAAACSLAAPAMAQETGLDALHAQVRVGGKICMLDHYHDGASNGAGSRKQAEAEAIESWASFTAWEYGNNWGSWRLAEGKSVSCDRGSGSWTCTLQARPCKPAGGRHPRKRR
ncbi:MAG: hypothetical protein ACM31O_17940 [Bacteroidota bacterium]|jgi:hypothetical protein